MYEIIVAKDIASILFEKGKARDSVTVASDANKYPPKPAVMILSIVIFIPYFMIVLLPKLRFKTWALNQLKSI